MTTLDERIDQVWDDDIVPTLCDYITIPNVSADYDADWEANGFMEQAVAVVRDWCAARAIAGLTVDVQRLPGRTPLIVCEVPATDPGLADRTVLLYGHLDKQPEMTGWRDGLGPWTPVIEGDRLYGRGGADDGYAAFVSLLAIEAAQADGIAHGRLIVLVEASEESGSPDLPAHLTALGDRLGAPELVVCLDSGCLDTERLWVTTSLRGLVSATVTVEVLTEGVHSGEASGVAPSSFRLLRQLLDRIEEATTGRILLPELHVEVPEDRRAEATATAARRPEVGGRRAAVRRHDTPDGRRPRRPVARPDLGADAELRRRRRAAADEPGRERAAPIDVPGAQLPPPTDVRPRGRVAAIERTVLADAPSGATVRFERAQSAPGWNAPSFAPWLVEALDEVSTAAFGRPARTFGEGGTIPFMGMLGEMFPAAQFVITGALAPGSNAHGPNEFLHLPTARRVTACIARLLGAHAVSPRSA